MYPSGGSCRNARTDCLQSSRTPHVEEARLPQRSINHGAASRSALIAHTAWHWLAERWTQLNQFPLPMPDAATLPALLRWIAAAIVLCLVLWACDGWLRRRWR